MGQQTLILLDTNHIKKYVFATDQLKDIRGGSSILDGLNRNTMVEIARKFEKCEIDLVYTNGGTGMFLVKADKGVAEAFGRVVQKEYTEKTNGGGSITFAVQEVPENINPWTDKRTSPYLKLLSLRLQQNQVTLPQVMVLPSHPFMSPCASCGAQYAEDKEVADNQHLLDAEDEEVDDDQNPPDSRKCYCNVCLAKREEDNKVKKSIRGVVNKKTKTGYSYIWQNVIDQLRLKNYDMPKGTNRPSDFNKLRGTSSGKDYLALIYADGNGMGKKVWECKTLPEREQLADRIDSSVYVALSVAIEKHLKVVQPGEGQGKPMFPFDILMIGGDDIVVVTPADVAMDVALTIAKSFQEETKRRENKDNQTQNAEGNTLSIGVVLAPIKYPFGMLQDLAESALKFAKQEGARDKKESVYGETRINFLVVAGSTSQDFGTVYTSLHRRPESADRRKDNTEFYATLRPYTVEDLEVLLTTIREGKKLSLGRTKLHRVREAVLKMNLTASVTEALAVLRNWREKQREFVAQKVYKLAEQYKEWPESLDKPGALFPRVIFPWFADGVDVYRTPLLDFVELYDFVKQEGGNSGEES